MHIYIYLFWLINLVRFDLLFNLLILSIVKSPDKKTGYLGSKSTTSHLCTFSQSLKLTGQRRRLDKPSEMTKRCDLRARPEQWVVTICRVGLRKILSPYLGSAEKCAHDELAIPSKCGHIFVASLSGAGVGWVGGGKNVMASGHCFTYNSC